MASDIPPPATHEGIDYPSDDTTFANPYFTGRGPLDRLREFRLSPLIDSMLLSNDNPPSTFLGPSVRAPELYRAFPDFPFHADDIPFHGRGPTGPAYPIAQYGDGLRILKHWPSSQASQQWARWHRYMKKFKADHWSRLGIDHLLEFTTRPYGRHHEAIAAALHFWVHSTNCFYFRDRPMTPTLLDLKLLLDIPLSGLELTPSRPYKDDYISHAKFSSFGPFVQTYFIERDTGPTDSEYFAFLSYFLGRFVIYSAAKGPTKVMYPLAAALLETQTQISLGPVLLGNLYRCLRHYSADLSTSSPVTGPIWILQMWLHMYLGHALCYNTFQPHEPSFWTDLTRIRRPLYPYFLDFVGLDFEIVFSYFYDHGQPCQDAHYHALAFTFMTAADWGSALASRDLFLHNATGSKTEKGVELYSANMVARQLGFTQDLPAPIAYSVSWSRPISFSRATIAVIDQITRVLIQPIAVSFPSDGTAEAFPDWWSPKCHSFYRWPSASAVLAITDTFSPRGPAASSDMPPPPKRRAIDRPSSSRAVLQPHRPLADTARVTRSRSHITDPETLMTHRRITRLVSRALHETRSKKEHDKTSDKETKQPTPVPSPSKESSETEGQRASTSSSPKPSMDTVSAFPGLIPTISPGVLDPTSSLIPVTSPPSAPEGTSTKEGSPIVSSLSAIIPHEEVSSVVPTSDERPSTPPDSFVVMIVDPVLEPGPSLLESEFVVTTHSPLHTSVPLSPPVTIASLSEEMEPDSEVAPPADTSVGEHHRSLKDRLSSILDRSLDQITIGDFSTIGQILSDLLPRGFTGHLLGPALEDLASRLSHLKAAHTSTAQEITTAGRHMSAFDDAKASLSDFQAQCVLLQEKHDATIAHRDSLLAQVAGLKQQIAADDKIISQLKSQLDEAPTRLHQLGEDVSTRQAAASFASALAAFRERDRIRISHEWTVQLKEFKELIHLL